MAKKLTEKQIEAFHNLGFTDAEIATIYADDLKVDAMKMSEVNSDLTAEQQKVSKQARQADREKKAENAPKTARTVKKDDEKLEIIAKTAEFLQNLAGNVQISNPSKVIEFDLNGNHYKFDLIKQRKSKS